MKTLISIFLVAFLCIAANAQSVFVVQGETGSSVHLTLKAAVDSAMQGDYIYLPGGNFNIGDFKIDKHVNIIGAGHYPDSTQVTGRTQLGGNIIFTYKASNSSIQGIYLTGNISFENTSADSTISNILISRSNINMLHYGTTGNANQRNINSLVRECVIRSSIYAANSIGHIIENTILCNNIQTINGDFQFKNCIFTYNYSYLFWYVNNASFTNCIFADNQNGGSFNGYNNYYSYCIFHSNSLDTSNHLFSNCVKNVSYTSNFKNAVSGAFSYDHDYHLSDTTVALSAGTNGTQCGIYGGENPYKDGAVPINPHIYFKNIPTATNSQGKLEVQIKVQAQER